MVKPVQQEVADEQSKPVPLSDILSTEDGVRRTIQALSNHIDDLEARVKALEANGVTKEVVQ